jgi:hypothetical protein
VGRAKSGAPLTFTLGISMVKYYFIFIAAIGVVGSLLLLASRIALLLNGVNVSGVVKKKQKRTWGDTDGSYYAYHLVIGYIDKNGVKMSFTEQNSIPSYFYNVGDSIVLLQDPDKPEKIMVRSNVVLFSAPLVILLLSAAAGYVGFK